MKKIIVIDQTLREGMQYRGLVFSGDERKKILTFQEALGIDVCQGGYPPAHESEVTRVRHLQEKAVAQGFRIRIAGLGRVFPSDVERLLDSGISDFHFHMAASDQEIRQRGVADVFGMLEEACRRIRAVRHHAVIGLSILDIGKSDTEVLKTCCRHLSEKLELDLITLPDTSGIMAPNLIYQKVSEVCDVIRDSNTKISVHCHNDMGMASANTVMGALAGAQVVEVTALGIGERNGLGDLFTVCRILKDQGKSIQVRVDQEALFEEYYRFVDDICRRQTGEPALTYNTPFFGDALKTHVAGTHAGKEFGIKKEMAFFLNLLCGKQLVRKYLEIHRIAFREERIPEITREIKRRSAEAGRSLLLREVREIVENESLSPSGDGGQAGNRIKDV